MDFVIMTRVASQISRTRSEADFFIPLDVREKMHGSSDINNTRMNVIRMN
jgi:hypothetical protein